jgi:hypothetical protein
MELSNTAERQQGKNLHLITPCGILCLRQRLSESQNMWHAQHVLLRAAKPCIRLSAMPHTKLVCSTVANCTCCSEKVVAGLKFRSKASQAITTVTGGSLASPLSVGAQLTVTSGGKLRSTGGTVSTGRPCSMTAVAAAAVRSLLLCSNRCARLTDGQQHTV